MAPRAQDLDRTCSVPDELIELSHTVTRTVGRIRRGEPVRVLAIGSSSTLGVGASSKEHAYPAQLEHELKERFPGVQFSVINAGVGGEVAVQTLRRLKGAVQETALDLVIWQVGTNDAMTNIDQATFAAHIRDGIAASIRHGRDLILIDQQLAPGARDPARYERYVEAIREVANAHSVPLLRRFDVMEYWAGERSPPPVLSHDRLHMNDLGYSCIAQILAEAIERQVLAKH